MKLGIVGLPHSGKTTVFEALTQGQAQQMQRGGLRIGTVQVPDERVDRLRTIYQPQKTTYAQVTYYLPPTDAHTRPGTVHIAPIRDCHAVVHVVRNFGGYGFESPTPLPDFRLLDQDLILSDLMVVEKRLARIALDQKRGLKADPEEWELLSECRQHLESETALRQQPHLARATSLRGFALVSAKPMMVLFNNEDEDVSAPDCGGLAQQENCMVIRGKLEQELAQMTAEDASEFLTEFNIAASAKDRVIQKSYSIQGLISFFTVLNKEVRAWTIRKGTKAQDAAGTVHSDMQKGFIRAEVVAYQDLIGAGSYQAAKKMGAVRLEGKTYPVQDGDVIQFRFNV